MNINDPVTHPLPLNKTATTVIASLNIAEEVEGDIRDKVEPKDPEEKITLMQTRYRLSQWFAL